jgi:hypothetical protein
MSHHRWCQSVGDFDCRWSGDSRIVFKKHNSLETAAGSRSGVLVEIVSSCSLRKFAAVRYSGSKSRMMLVALNSSYDLIRPDRKRLCSCLTLWFFCSARIWFRREKTSLATRKADTRTFFDRPTNRSSWTKSSPADGAIAEGSISISSTCSR